MTARNSVLCVDALVLLASLPDASIDLVLSDPPYGTLTASLAWDVVVPPELLWPEFKRVMRPHSAIVLTASQPFTSVLVTSNLKMFRHEWIWRKSAGTGYLNANRQPMKNHESVLVFCDGQPKYYPQKKKAPAYRSTSGSVGGFVVDKSVGGYLTVNEGDRFPLSVMDFLSETGSHPTQKPVPLFEYLIRTYTQPGALVLDPFCGSGTTALAAQRAGRDFICGDTNADYVEVALKRLRDADPFLAREVAPGLVQASLFEVLP